MLLFSNGLTENIAIFMSGFLSVYTGAVCPQAGRAAPFYIFSK